MSKNELKIFIKENVKKLKTFLLLSLGYIILLTSVIFFFLGNFKKLTKEKLIFQETEVIKSLQKVVDFNFNAIYKDIYFINNEIESISMKNDDENFREDIEHLFYNFSFSKKSYSQIVFIDTTGKELYKVVYYDSIPNIVPEKKMEVKKEIDFFQTINQLNEKEIYTSKVHNQKDKINKQTIQVIRFGTPIYKNNQKIGVLILTYKFSDLIEIFNKFSIENEGKLILINKESKILISDEGKNNWFSISNDTTQIFFKDNFPKIWSRIQYSEKGSDDSEKGLFIFNTLDFSSDYTLKLNFYDKNNKWKIISIIDKQQLNSIIKTHFVVWFYVLTITSLIVFVLLYLLARNIQIRRAVYNQIILINNELKNKNEEIIRQRDNLAESNQLILSQKQILEKQSKDLQIANKNLKAKQLKHSESLQYAERIQAALLPTNQFLNNIFDEIFIFYKPKAIVSGDFYWADKFIRQNKELIVFAAADCTGHGIPGAFVSILGISLLNEILYRNDYQSPNLVLNEMRQQVKYMLKQKSVYSGQEDSIDMALCFLEKDKNRLQFSGANRPLLIINKEKNIKIYEPTENPIGIYMKETKFQNIEIMINADDKLYLFSDGITDQFNSKQQKFKITRLKKLIEDFYLLPMNQQKVEFEKDFENWKSGFIQIDDVLLMGIKI